MVDELIKKLLEAGVHFGHQTRRWNPKMKKFIFGARSGIYIIDLEKTVTSIHAAQEFARDIAAKGGRILFIGTKKQAQPVVQEESKKCDMFYISNRWMGGLLTNFETVKRSIDRIREIERMKEDGVWENLTKKEVAMLNKEYEKLMGNLGGILEMKVLPQAVFIIDTKREEIAVKEARKLKLPIIGVVDTNCDPELIDYPIPANDDALKSIRVVSALVADSVKDGRKDYLESETVKRSAQEKAKSSEPPEQERGESPAEAAAQEAVPDPSPADK